MIFTRPVPVTVAGGTAGAVTLTAAVTAAVAAALLPAGTAHAAPQPLNGIYTAQSNEQLATWAISSACTGERCVANINSSSGWSGTATLADGHWHMTVNNPVGFVCRHKNARDSTPFPATMVYSIDAATLAGTVGYEDDGECGNNPGWRENPFTLTKMG